MGLGLVALWCGLAVALAVAFHRLRQRAPSLPTEVREFLAKLEGELAQHDDVEWLGLLPGQFSGLLRVLARCPGQPLPTPAAVAVPAIQR